MGREGSCASAVSINAPRIMSKDVLGNPRVELGLRVSDMAVGKEGEGERVVLRKSW